MQHIEIQEACECMECIIKRILEMQIFQTFALGLFMVILLIGGILYANFKEKI